MDNTAHKSNEDVLLSQYKKIKNKYSECIQELEGLSKIMSMNMLSTVDAKDYLDGVILNHKHKVS